MQPPQSGPGPILSQSSAYWKSCALQASVKLDVFTTIGAGQLSAEEIASKLSVDQRAVEALLHALCAMEYLTKSNGRFSRQESLR